MKKNVASQSIGAQMISSSDGTAFTGSVTVYVTGDAGTQAVGSVGSGACTHEGNGYHTYAPAQAETNYDLIAFTFVGTGAVPVTVQVFAGFPQTVDNNTKIDAVKTKTDFLPSATAGATGGVFIAGTNAATAVTTALTANITGNVSGSVNSVTGAVGSVTGAVGSVTGSVNVGSLNGSSSAAANLQASCDSMEVCLVDTAVNTHTPTTTEFQSDTITEANADQFIGRVVRFTSGTLDGQEKLITDYALVGGIGQFTVEALTDAPANNDTFLLI